MEEEQDHAAEPGQANEVGEGSHMRSCHVSFRFCFQSADLRNMKLRRKSGCVLGTPRTVFCSKWHITCRRAQETSNSAELVW